MSGLDFFFFTQVGFNQKDVPNVEKEVVEQYVWELKEQCRSDRYWGVGKKINIST